MQVRLQTPVKPDGDKITVKIKYDFAIPVYGADRMGRLNTKNGIVYELAQWYPRMCVYDDIESWNTLPYMGLERILLRIRELRLLPDGPRGHDGGGLRGSPESGRGIDAKGSKPAGRGPQERRHGDDRQGRRSWSGILPPQDHEATLKPAHYQDGQYARRVLGRLQGLYLGRSQGQPAFGSSATIAMSAYPVEAAGNDRYGRSTEYLKRSMELYSTKYFEYPWNSAVSVAGVALGMEYPGIIFCKSDLKNGSLWGDVTHEIGHNWFPHTIVGSE